MIKIYIDERDYKNALAIYIIDEAHDGTRKVWRDRQWIDFDHTSSDEEPTLHLGGHMVKEFLLKMSTYCQGKGVRPEQSYIEGRLEATGKHLDDMRDLSRVLLNDKLGLKDDGTKRKNK